MKKENKKEKIPLRFMLSVFSLMISLASLMVAIIILTTR